jgi:integrase
MARIRLRYVNEFIDRHGKVRYYFRRPGSRSVKLPGLPGSIQFMDAYAAAIATVAPPPSSSMQYLITDARGRQLRGVTNLMLRAAQAAGLPAHCKAHGLRKAALRRLAEHGSTTKELAAMSGHRSLKELQLYTEHADQVRLAQSAVAKLPDENKA